MIDEQGNIEIFEDSIVLFLNKEKTGAFIRDIELSRLNPDIMKELKNYIPLCICNNPGIVATLKNLCYKNLFEVINLRTFLNEKDLQKTDIE